MSRIKIAEGKYVSGNSMSLPYFEFIIQIDTENELSQMATVLGFDIYNKEYMTTCGKKQPDFDNDINNKLTTNTPFVRMYQESSLTSGSIAILFFRYIDGYIEQHIFRIPELTYRYNYIETIEIKVDASKMRMLTIIKEEQPVKSQEPLQKYQIPSYYETIKKVEANNGAFPCIFLN